MYVVKLIGLTSSYILRTITQHGKFQKTQEYISPNKAKESPCGDGLEYSAVAPRVVEGDEKGTPCLGV
jgi:hypothetical protein